MDHDFVVGAVWELWWVSVMFGAPAAIAVYLQHRSDKKKREISGEKNLYRFANKKEKR